MALYLVHWFGSTHRKVPDHGEHQQRHCLVVRQDLYPVVQAVRPAQAQQPQHADEPAHIADRSTHNYGQSGSET